MANKNPQPRKKRTKAENDKIRNNRQAFCERIEDLCQRRKEKLYEYGYVPTDEDNLFSSYRSIANELEISESEFCRYRKGDADVPNWVLSKLATLFNTSADYLIGRIPEEYGTFSDHLLASQLGISRDAYDNLCDYSRDSKFRLILNALLSAKCTDNMNAYAFRNILNDAYHFAELTLQENEVKDEKTWLVNVKNESKYNPKELKHDNFALTGEYPLDDKLKLLDQKKESVVLDLYNDFKQLLIAIADQYNTAPKIIEERKHRVNKWIGSTGIEVRKYAQEKGNNPERICNFINNRAGEVSLEEIEQEFSHVDEEAIKKILDKLSKDRAIMKAEHGYCAVAEKGEK